MSMMATSNACGPLAGVRIVEFDAIGPLPLAAMLLADMGADVVRIARPRQNWSAWNDVGGAILHRSRRAVELDLKIQSAAALELIALADIVIEGFRPGVMERLGLGPAICLAANPALVYGRVTGWGQDGPLARRAGHDLNYIGLTGALRAIGPADAPPPVPLNLIGDYGGGSMFLIAGVMAALISARTTGVGQVVDAAMTDGVAALTAMFHAFRLNGSWENERYANLLDGAAPYYRCYRCRDGGFVAVCALEPQFYALLLAVLDLAPDDHPQHDRSRWPATIDILTRIFASRPRDIWASLFCDTDACVTPVLDWDEAPVHPHNRERATFVEHHGISQPAPAPRFSATPCAIRDAKMSTAASVAADWARRGLPQPERPDGNRRVE